MSRSGKRTYVWRKGSGLIDVTDIVQAPPEPRVHIIDDRPYFNLSVQGYEYDQSGQGKKGKLVPIDLSSYSKHRKYMKERGLTHVSDFDQPGGFWEREAARRERVLAGTDPEDNKRRTERVVEAVKKLEQGYRPPPPERVEHTEDYPVIQPKE